MGLVVILLVVFGVSLILACIGFTAWSLYKWGRGLFVHNTSTTQPTTQLVTSAQVTADSSADSSADGSAAAATGAAAHIYTDVPSPAISALNVPLTASVAAAPFTQQPSSTPAAFSPLTATTAPIAMTTVPVAPVPIVMSPTTTATPTTPITPTAPIAASMPWKALKPGAGNNVCLSSGGTLAACNSSAAQGWYLDPATGLLYNAADGNCLTAASVSNSVNLSDTPCSASNPNQQWASPSGGQLLLNGNKSLSLDVPGGLAAPGAQMSTWFVNGSPTQVWNFV